MLITPQSLIDDIINAVNIMVYRAIEAIEEGLLSIPINQLGFSSKLNSTAQSEDPDCVEARDEIENGVHQLETLLEATVDKSFDKFELYTLRNILTVPDDLAPWMRLSHYEVRRPTILNTRPFQSPRLQADRAKNTGYTTSPSVYSSNARIHPRPPAQAPRNAQTQPCPPLHPRQKRSPHLSTQRHPFHIKHLLYRYTIKLPRFPDQFSRPRNRIFGPLLRAQIQVRAPHHQCAIRNIATSSTAHIGRGVAT